MEYIKNGIVYVIPSIIMCSLFNLIFKNRASYKNYRERICIYELSVLLFIVYITIVFANNISPVYGFSNVINWSQNLNLNILNIFNFICNKPRTSIKAISIFLPIGILLPIFSSIFNRPIKCGLVGLCSSLFIEVFQLFLYKGSDINHVIFGFIGGYLGWVIYYIIVKFRNEFLNKNVVKIYDKNIKDIIYIYVCISISVVFTGFFINNKNFKSYALDNQYEYQIEANNAYLIDAKTNEVLFEKESNERVAPASTAKMITALTVLDYCNLDEEVIVGDEIGYVCEDASIAGLTKGNKLTIYQLLEGLLLPSGNDAAYVLARYCGEKIEKENTSIDGSIDIFMKAVNEKAKVIGAYNSNFVRPDGYDEKNQYSSANDLALIAEKFLKSDILMGIVSSYEIEDELLDGSKVKYRNTNELINPYSEYFYSNIKGLKTGSSSQAGKCLVSVADIEESTYICVVMGSSDKGRYQDSLCLYQSVK